MKQLLILIALGLLCACTQNVRPEPVNENCEAICRTPCDTTIPLWTPADVNDPRAWDTYPRQVTIPLKVKLDNCELARVACVQCLDRLKKAGVTK